MNPVWPWEAPAPAPAPGEVAAPPVELPLADFRHPVMVTVFPVSLCDWLALGLVLGV